MEGILEFFVTLIGEILSGSKYKNTKARTWVLTIFTTVLAATLIWFIVWNAIDLLQQGSTAGVAVMCFLALTITIVALIIIIRGHRKNWENY